MTREGAGGRNWKRALLPTCLPMDMPSGELKILRSAEPCSSVVTPGQT